MSVSPRKLANSDEDAALAYYRQRSVPIWLRPVLVAVGIVLGLGALELALRYLPILHRGSEFDSISDLRRSILSGLSSDQDPEHEPITLGGIILPHPNDQIIYDLKPGIQVAFREVSTTTNSCGMRWRETSIVKPANTYRIAMLGDSFAFGWGVPEADSFSRVLEDTLNSISHGKPNFEVLNFGVPGYSTFQEVALFKERGLDFDPDAVIVYFVDNDFGLPFFIRDRSGFQLTEVLNFSQRPQSENASDDERDAKPMQLDPSRALLELASIATDRGIKLYLAINPRKSWRGIRSRLWALKQHPEIMVMPLFDELVISIKARGIPDEELQLKGDPHPAVPKHRILGEIMAPYFLPVMESQSR